MENRHGWHRGRFTALHIAGMVILGVITAFVVAFVFGFLVQWLWNWLMPGLFGLARITYWQGFGLVLLGRLLFGTIGHHLPGSRRHGHHHKWDWDEDDWKIHGSWRNWDHYDEWWRAEGKAAFEQYVERRNGAKEHASEE